MNKVCIGVITGDFIRTKTVQTLLQLIKTPFVAQAFIQQGPYIHLNRDLTVLSALKGDYTHLFFVDNDVCFAVETLERLLSRDKDIIAAPYHLRKLPKESMIKITDEKGNLINGELSDLPKEPFKCWAIGTGCMLIKMDVFKKIPRPWFFYGKPTETEEGMGEDIWFCDQAHKAGFDVWVDPTIQVGHIGEYLY